MRLTNRDIERIELKWECIRRNPDYRRDYERQQQDEKDYEHTGGPNCNYNYWRWSIPNLLDPGLSVQGLRKNHGKNYENWVRAKFITLIEDDRLNTDRRVHLKSINLEKIIYPETFYSRISLNQLHPKWYREHVLSKIDRNKIVSDLKNCTISFNAMAPTEELCKSFEDLIRRIKKRIKWNKRPAYRLNEVLMYLKEFDRPTKAPYASSAERIRRRYKQKARKLIAGDWRLI